MGTMVQLGRLAGILLLVTVVSEGLLLEGRPNKTEWEAEQAKKQAAAAGQAAKEAKMAAVNKVVEMLESVKTKVLEEGEEEAATYNKFACFCKDTTKEKKEAISHGEDEKADLTAHIQACETERKDMDKTIKDLEGEIEEAEKKMKEKTKEREANFAVYSKDEADLSGALTGLGEAIKVLKASKEPSLLQVQGVSNSVKTSLLLADALGLEGAAVRKLSTIFLQQAPDVPMENYKFKSDGVIATLEALQKKFTITKEEVDAAEVKSVAEYDAYMQLKSNYVKAKTKKLGATEKSRDKKSEEIATANAEVTEVAANLLDDQQYLSELADGCNIKARTWDQRTKMRADELYVLTEVVGIMKGAVAGNTSAATVRLNQGAVSLKLAEAVSGSQRAMEAIEAGAEMADSGSIPSLLQRGAMHRAAKPVNNVAELTGRSQIASLLKTKGTELHSSLLTSLAQRIASSADPFGKIKKLIQDLIEKLLQEAANEANQKGWCDKAQADAKQNRQYASEEIEELNTRMAELEANRDQLNEDLDLLAKEIAELKQARKDADAIRTTEKAENEATIMEAQSGMEAVSMAIDILDKFYKTAAKGKVSLSQGPFDGDAPDAGFKDNEAYTGAQGAASGIVGMLDVMKSDFERTIAETEVAEQEAEAEHLKFMTKTGISLAEKTTAVDVNTKQRDEAVTSLAKAGDDLDFETQTLETAIKELIELKPACVDTGMSYEERVARREDEIASLKKALCILEAYAEYGPDGLADAC